MTKVSENENFIIATMHSSEICSNYKFSIACQQNTLYLKALKGVLHLLPKKLQN